MKNRKIGAIYNNALSITQIIQISSLRIDAALGVNDAYCTTMSIGLMQILLGNLISFLSPKFYDFNVDYVNICGNYQLNSANGRLQCILHFNLAHIIFALIRAVIKIRRSK
ncbi:MAG: hypothetical protein IKJ75_06060 [Clostridia bacterium]|nr:hypothetical protein [Clostridia bacterium]